MIDATVSFFFNIRIRLETISPEIGIDPPIRTVVAEDLLTRITSVPQRQTAQMNDRRQRPQVQQMGFRQSLSSLSQMEMSQNPSKNSVVRRGNIDIDLQNLANPTPKPEEGVNGSPPYWLNPLYLAAILSQNNNGAYYSGKTDRKSFFLDTLFDRIFQNSENQFRI